MANAPAQPGKRSERLTDRELEYVVLVCQEKEPTPEQIAELMGCKEKTVESHRYHVYRKWKVRTRTELLFKAVKLGLVTCPCGGVKAEDNIIDPALIR